MSYRDLPGQSAIEYLTTYGWMLLAVSIISGVIFALPQSGSVDNINWPQGENAYIDDSGVTGEDELSLNIQNQGGDKLIISEVKIIDPDTEEWIAQNFTTNPSIGVANDKIFQIPNMTRGESVNTLDVELTYNSGSLENLQAKGTISGNLQLEETDLTYEASNEASREYYYEGESRNLDVSDLDSVDVVVEGAGGVTSDESPPR